MAYAQLWMLLLFVIFNITMVIHVVYSKITVGNLTKERKYMYIFLWSVYGCKSSIHGALGSNVLYCLV